MHSPAVRLGHLSWPVKSWSVFPWWWPCRSTITHPPSQFLSTVCLNIGVCRWYPCIQVRHKEYCDFFGSIVIPSALKDFESSLESLSRISWSGCFVEKWVYLDVLAFLLFRYWLTSIKCTETFYSPTSADEGFLPYSAYWADISMLLVAAWTSISSVLSHVTFILNITSTRKIPQKQKKTLQQRIESALRSNNMNH